MVSTAEPVRPDTRAWLVLGMLCFVYVLNFLDRQLLSILAKPIQDELHVTDGQLGLISGLYFALFYCLISIPVGWLADRTNRVRVLSFACALWSAATVACGFASSYPQLVLARMYENDLRFRTTMYAQSLLDSLRGTACAQLASGGATNGRLAATWTITDIRDIARIDVAISVPQRTGAPAVSKTIMTLVSCPEP